MINKATILGRLGADPEVRHLENGVMVANINVATTEVYKDRNTGERRESTEWHRIVLWRGLADIAEKYLKKGDLVYIEGKIETRSYQDQTGVTKYTTDIVAREMKLMPKARPEGAPAPAAAPASQKPQPEVMQPQTNTMVNDPLQAPAAPNTAVDDDLPF
ncbi:single-stranded DNA-binding protein [Persicobacter diffluens]|uniref:Single-stranded DNA-binding protein n=1 Tax=Persicobacter diffluens TaxID=981 RepID=A0AAN4VV15_9BACT|nr:single-stranded DNA-binding protein [Persicobacter diffluens]